MPSDLEVFYLALVQHGLSSAYLLKARAGLSLGSSLPVLARLEKAGLITSSRAAARGKRAYRLTRTGTTTLRRCAKAVLKARPKTADAVAQAACVGLLLGQQAGTAAFLNRAAATGTQPTPLAPLEANDPVLFYRSLRSRLAAARAQASSRVFSSAATQVARRGKRTS